MQLDFAVAGLLDTRGRLEDHLRSTRGGEESGVRSGLTLIEIKTPAVLFAPPWPLHDIAIANIVWCMA